jgi:hypothetical protein
MTWVKWSSKEEFDLWHEAKKIELGLPFSKIVTEYTFPIVVSEQDVRADIETVHVGDLELSENPYLKSEIF